MDEQNQTPKRTVKNLSTSQKKKAMIAALKATLGNVSQSCEKVSIDRQTHYNWLKNDPKYNQQVDDIAEASIDFAESKLLMNIKDGKETSLIFYLKTKGVKRGYVETQQVISKVVEEFEDYTDEELLEIANKGYGKK